MESILKRVFIVVLVLFCGCLMAEAQTINTVRNAAPYIVQLQVPANGFFAGEVSTLDFNISDISRGDAMTEAAAVHHAVIKPEIVLMPFSLPVESHPLVRDNITSGGFSLTAIFPCMGKYRITLAVFPPNDSTPFPVVLEIAVKAEKGITKAPTPPSGYMLSVKPGGNMPSAGKPVNLIIGVTDKDANRVASVTGATGGQPMSLIVVRDDLSSFYYDRPVLGPDGSFATTMTFPTAGNWRLFADFSQDGSKTEIVPVTIPVSGMPTVREVLKPAVQPKTTEDGVTLALQTKNLPSTIVVPLVFTLTDSGDRPIKDIPPNPGGIAHLILIEQDGMTFVIARSEEVTPVQTQPGQLTFLTHFPKPGIYKGWVQFERGGETKTMAFVVRSTSI